MTACRLNEGAECSPELNSQGSFALEPKPAVILVRANSKPQNRPRWWWNCDGNLRFRVLTACWSLYFRRACERNGNSAAIRKSIVPR
jgi:hypothetical protein